MTASLHDQCIAAIRTRLDVTGMSQAELARMTKTTQKHVSRVLRGHDPGSWAFIERCLRALGTRPVLVLADVKD